MKKHIKLLLRTLISNNACVEAARTKEPKSYNFIAIIFVLFALFFAALPTCVTGFQQQGGSFISGATYGFDTAMIDFAQETQKDDKQITFTISANHELTANNWSSIGVYDVEKHNDLNCYISMSAEQEGQIHKIMEFYVCPDNCDFTLFVEELVKNINPVRINGYKDGQDKDAREKEPKNWLERDADDKDGNPVRKNRSTSFIAFGTKQIQAALYVPGNTAIASSVYGDYGNTEPTNNLISRIVVDKNPDKTIEACKSFFNEVYVNPRRVNTWRSTGIILGVDAGVILLMGFMVWILTRGKNNPFRIYSFWDGQKIAYYACLTPGIISLFGFLMSNMAMMLFILGAGIRVMWLSMRTLRYQAPEKQ